MFVNGLPENFQINFEVTMSQGIPHFISIYQWQRGVLLHEIRKLAINVLAGFPDHFEISDYGILKYLIF